MSKEQEEMSKSEGSEHEAPPFFKDWKGLYAFVLIFELALILLFVLITQSLGS